jgi:hypothetical protein
MGRHKTPEEIAWLGEHAPRHPRAETVKLFNQRFGVALSVAGLASWVCKHGLRLDSDVTQSRVWTDTEKAYLEAVTPGRSHVEIQGLMCKRFKRAYSVKQIANAIKRYGLNTGRTGRFEPGQTPPNKGKSWDEYLSPAAQAACRKTQFEAGRMPHTTVPVGTEKLRDDGYLWRKVKETKPSRHGWKQVHRIVWEEAHGPVPDGHVVVFRDGDTTNITLDNLMLCSRAERGVMNSHGLAGSGESGRLVADLIIAAVRRSRSDSKTDTPTKERSTECR